MDHMNSAFPALVAFLAGITFLYRVWSRQSIWNHPSSSHSKTRFNTSTLTENNKTHAVSKESDYPDGWLTGKPIFELERRAIFSKTWIPLAHHTRFSRAGDYQSFNIAGFPIVLIHGRDNKIRAFHNVCRHRAYPITKKEYGTSTVLGCRYHGWSYNTYGELIKAPHFDNVPGFEKAQNGLFEIRTFTSSAGVVFVNLQAAPLGDDLPETGDLDGFAGRNGIGLRGSWLGGTTLEGAFNWKVALRSKHLVDNLGLKLQTSPSFVRNVLSYFQRKPETFNIFPTTFIYTIPSSECWFSLNLTPITEKQTSIRCDLYSHRKMKDEASQALLASITTHLRNTIRELETKYQSFSASSEPASALSDLDPGSADTQNHILNLLKEHSKLEKLHGAEILPATREPRRHAKYEQAEQLCKELDCGDGPGHESLAW